MCANFKPITATQVKQLGLPAIPFTYQPEVFPGFEMPLLITLKKVLSGVWSILV